MLALSLATPLTLLLAGTIMGTIPGLMIRRGTVQTEFFPEATPSLSVSLLQGQEALSTAIFALGTSLQTKFSRVPVFATICAMSFLAITLSLSTLSLPVLSTPFTANLVLIAAILTTSPTAALPEALGLVLPASSAVHSPDLGCIFMLGPIAVFTPPILIHQDLMDSFHCQLLSMHPSPFIHLIQFPTIFTVLHQGVHKNLLCPIGCNRHGLSEQKTLFQHPCFIFLQRLSRRRL